MMSIGVIYDEHRRHLWWASASSMMSIGVIYDEHRRQGWVSEASANGAADGSQGQVWAKRARRPWTKTP